VKKLGSVELEKETLFLIPMYKEKKMAKETFDFFLNIAKTNEKAKVVFVCTAKEDGLGEDETTYDLLSSYKKEANCESMFVYKYPKTTGIMAHQVNYGVKKYCEDTNSTDFWVAIYNCDSRLDNISLNEIFYNINNAKTQTVFQQYSYYYVPNKRFSSIPLSSAVWQTRWSIFKENAMARNRCGFRKKIKNFNAFYALFEPFSYCIGHGIIINAETFIKVGGMPEDSINEDTFMGYVICSEGLEIQPLYSLERAESVSSTRTLINQQASWFNGPVNSLKYYEQYCNDNDCTFKRPICKKENKLRSKIRAFKSFDYALAWMFSPVILLIILPIVSILGYSIFGILISVLTAEFYLFIINLVMFFALRENGIKAVMPSPIFDILFYFCHGLSTFIWLFRNLSGKNRIDNKYKTER